MKLQYVGGDVLLFPEVMRQNLILPCQVYGNECYAASNGETVWKKYGKRYYTAKYKRNIGPGHAVICSENHYTVSKKGISERYATTWLDSMTSLTGTIYEKGYSVYSDAKKAGQTTGIKVRVTFKYQTNLGGAKATSYVTIYERLNIEYVKHDTKNKKIKVKHSWKKVS